MTVDPLTDNYPGVSPYAYCGWNPVRFVDRDGRDWYEAEDGTITWTKYGSQEEMTKNGIIGIYLGKAVLDFHGSFFETLGTKDVDMTGYDPKFGNWGYIDGIGAITAEVTMYGPNRENDITQGMVGFTMSSDYSTFGAIESGNYTVTFVSPGKSGKLKSNWLLTGEIKEYGGQLNLSPQAGKNYGTPYKNAIYIHSTNQSGYAGITAWTLEGLPFNAISVGCLLLAPNDFNLMNQKMSGLRSFVVRVVR